MLKKTVILAAILAALSVGAKEAYRWHESQQYPNPYWTSKERLAIESLWLDRLHSLPEDPSNQVADNTEAAEFGRLLFFDKRLSVNGEVACATCHDPEKYFTDGKTLATGIGVTSRNSPSIVASAYQPFIFWDGRADSQWAQALGPLENDVEHGGSRMQYVHLIANDPVYRKRYHALFSAIPDLTDTDRFPARAGPGSRDTDTEITAAWQAMREQDKKLVSQIYANIGKVIAAYERLMMPAPSRFDHYVQSLKDNSSQRLNILSRDEVAGLRLFIGKARCIECHNGPLFSNDSFANIGTPTPKGKVYDFGRSRGALEVVKSEFNCNSEYSDAQMHECSELRFIKLVGDDLIGAFKVPGLRNTSKTAPYMHAGQLKDLDDVMDHYNNPPITPFGHNMLTKLELEPHQLKQIIAFLHTLDSRIDVENHWLTSPENDQYDLATNR